MSLVVLGFLSVTGIFRIKGHICFPPGDADIENSSCASVPFECQKNAILFVRRMTVTPFPWASTVTNGSAKAKSQLSG